MKIATNQRAPVDDGESEDDEEEFDEDGDSVMH